MESFSNWLVDVGLLKQNAINIKNAINGKKFCAVVKADAYGLGVATVCKCLFSIADYFAVSNINEALEIRSFDLKTPIIILGVIDKSMVKVCQKNNIMASVSNLDKIDELEDACKKTQSKIDIHLQINTGLNRYGFSSLDQFEQAVMKIQQSKHLKLSGVYSHFATKNQDVNFMKEQFYLFKVFQNSIKNQNVTFHMANSFGTLLSRCLHLNMVRCGFLTYGGTENEIGNEFVLSITSKIVNILHVEAGQTIGYDRKFVAKKPMKIAVVPLGYADGMDRRLSGNLSVLVNKTYCKIVGNICMDVFMIDVSNANAKMYDTVVVLGKQGDKQITINDFAAAMNASPYEALLKLNYKRMNYITKNSLQKLE